MKKLIQIVIIVVIVLFILLSVFFLGFYDFNRATLYDFNQTTSNNFNQTTSKSSVISENKDIAKADRFGFVWTNTNPNNDLNFKWIRPLTAPFRRDYIEQTEGVYNFSLTDEFVRRAQENNVSVLPTIFPYPAWEQPTQLLELLRDKKVGENRKSLSLDNQGLWAPPVYKGAPKDMDSYKRFVRALVERYDGDGKDDMPGLKYPIKYWEVINEPNNDYPDQFNITDENIEMITHSEEYFFGTGESYANVLKATYLAVKEADPDALVLIGGLEPPPRKNIQGIDFFNEYYNFYDNVINSSSDYFDIFNFHYLEADEETDVKNPIIDVEYLKERYGDNLKDKPIWITEFSVNKPDKLIIAIIKSMEKVDKIFLVGYLWQEGMPNNVNSISLRDEEGNLTSLYYPVKTLGLLAGNAKNINKINDNVYIFVYDDYKVFALWNNTGLPDNVSGDIILIDYNGNAQVIPADEFNPSDNVNYVVTGDNLEDFLNRFEKAIQVNETLSKKEKPTPDVQERDYGFFCFEEDFIDEGDIASLTIEDVKKLNVKYVRTLYDVFKWDLIETEKGTFNFSRTDYVVGQAADANVSLIATLYPYAVWDQENNEACERNICNPQDWNEYVLYLKELVERYDGDDDFGNYPITDELKEKIKQNPVLFWEINNEPDSVDDEGHPMSFDGDVNDYFEQLKNSYVAIKEVCKDCKVLIAAPTPEDPQGWYDELVLLGAKDYFDLYNFHPSSYTDKPLEIFDGVDKPVVYTETGGGKGAMIAKQSLTLIENGIDIACLTRAPPVAKYNEMSSKNNFNENDFFESTLLYRNGSKTDQYFALKTIATKLKDFTSYKKIQMDGVAAYIFYFENKNPVYVFYLDCDGVDSALFNPGLDNFSVEGLFGETRTFSQPFEIQNENVYFIQLNNDTKPVNYGLVGEYKCGGLGEEHADEDKMSKENNNKASENPENVTNKGICGDNYCTIEEAESNSCPQDCTDRFCGDGICDEMETKELCPQDCD